MPRVSYFVFMVSRIVWVIVVGSWVCEIVLAHSIVLQLSLMVSVVFDVVFMFVSRIIGMFACSIMIEMLYGLRIFMLLLIGESSGMIVVQFMFLRCWVRIGLLVVYGSMVKLLLTRVFVVFTSLIVLGSSVWLSLIILSLI